MSAAAGDSSARARPPRTPKCSRCRNHGLVVPVRGHSGSCVWRLCTCPKCALITERRKILAAHKQLRSAAGNRAHTPEDGSGDATTATPERTGSARLYHPRPVHAAAAGHPVFPSECVPGLDYFERETTRMYLGCPPMYHYPPFSLGMPASGFRGAAISPPGFPVRGIQPCHPLQDGGGDFRHSYYPPMPPFMPPGYLSGIHYMPPNMPLSVSVMAEPRRGLTGHSSAENQSLRIVSERSVPPNKEPST
ncbi:doublesex- and mab-3-related transcription factor B1 [Pseudophryne corroboree]|uniref:doublesex- and mab-3-related transcription factor B1 n=1 Tax=Pseudophryne corroboree TaxID=495146 RepID=UPI003081D27D